MESLSEARDPRDPDCTVAVILFGNIQGFNFGRAPSRHNIHAAINHSVVYQPDIATFGLQTSESRRVNLGYNITEQAAGLSALLIRQERGIHAPFTAVPHKVQPHEVLNERLISSRKRCNSKGVV